MSGTSPHHPHTPEPYGHDPASRPARGQVPDAAAQAPYGQPPQEAAGAYGRPPQGAPGTALHTAPGGAWQGAAQPQAGWPGQHPAPRRPGAITAAFWLILGGGLLFLLSSVLGALAVNTAEGRRVLEETMRDTYGQAGVGGTELDQMLSMVDGMLPAITAVMIAVGVAAFLLHWLIAAKIRGGSRAARTAGTVLAALSVLMLLGTLLGGAFSPLDLLWVGLGVAGIVMAHRRDATEYMRLKAWEKASRR